MAKDDFERALQDVKKLSDLSSTDLLGLYGLYKQATEGDVSGPKPGLLDIKGRAKYLAWAEHKGMTQPKARQSYVDLVKKLSS